MSSFTTPLKYSLTTKNRSGRPVYKIEEPFTYVIGSTNNSSKWEITVPIGFETDFITIPWPFNKFFKPEGHYSKAAVIHDYLYRTTSFEVTQYVADSIFYESLLVSGANRILAFFIFAGVRAFGKSFYDKRNKTFT